VTYSVRSCMLLITVEFSCDHLLYQSFTGLTSSLKVNVFSKSRDGRDKFEEVSLLGQEELEDMLV
jgi:hypothetical protein